jgi:hypothetical protein
MGAVFLADGDACYAAALAVLSAEAPVFMSRIGGSDTNALISYLQEQEWAPEFRQESTAHHQFMVKQFNGYYDKSGSDELYYSYCETLYHCYKQSPQLVFSNYQLLSLYFKNFIHPKYYVEDVPNAQGFRSLIEDIIRAQPDIVCYPYDFIERLVFDQWTLLRVFSTVLEGKKVLVVSPFGESIELNFPKRHRFFRRRYKYPDFALQVYNTPITYAGLPDEFYPHNNWFETLETMKAEIFRLDFDFALLSCGSYALPLGVFISQTMQRKAIYCGGILQMFFGILGRRWEDLFIEQANFKEFIYPVERERYLKHFQITSETATEGFGAYF